MHALIIEVHPLISMMLEDELREMGFTSCAITATQDAAVAAARRLRPDLITASVRLAEGSGIEAVRSTCAEQSIPTVFIVSNPAEVGDAIPNGIVITKPIAKDALQEAVKRVTQQMDDQGSPEAARGLAGFNPFRTFARMSACDPTQTFGTRNGSPAG